MNVTHRLTAFIKSLDMSIAAFEVSVGASGSIQAALTRDRAGFQTALLTKVADKYPILNMHWVITGHGEMLLNVGPTVATPPNEAAGTDAVYKAKYFETLEKLVSCMEENKQLMHKK